MKRYILLAIPALCAMGAWAGDQPFDVRPGLWSMDTTVQMSGLPPIPNLDQMPPEQRARIEAAMKGAMGTHTNTSKSCITKDGIDKAIAEASSKDKNNKCEPKIVNMTASKVVLHMECTTGTKGDTKSNGDMTIERQDAEHMKGSGTMKSEGNGGRTMDIKWTMAGTFVSANCGDVKPEK